MYLYPENNVEIKRKKHFGTFSFDSCYSTRLPPNLQKMAFFKAIKYCPKREILKPYHS